MYGEETSIGEVGLTRLATPRCCGKDERCEDASHDHVFFYAEEPTVYLPHSCNEWVIGGREQVEKMIDDLTNMLEFLAPRQKRSE